VGLVGCLSLRASLASPSATASASACFDAEAFAAIGGRAALARQGALYLAAHPHEHDAHRLRALLAPDTQRPVRESLLASIERDWRNHDVLTLDGWVLARSEARICALACLGTGA